MYKNLPELSYYTNELTGEVIGIKKGEMGYYPIKTKATAEELNNSLNITTAQSEAMYMGSLIGWEVPAANPDFYDENGKFKTNKL